MTLDSDQDRWIYRIGAAAACTGSVAGMVGNLLHPEAPIDDREGIARVIADSASWTFLHLVIVFGVALMLGALVALAHSINGGLAGALSKFGLAAGIAGITVGLILLITDGVAAKQLAVEWAAAPPDEQAAALRVVMANETVNFALASLFNILFAGITFILFGLAVAFSRVYPSWLGWIAVVAGVGSIGAGLVQAITREPTLASRILTIIGPTVITLWLFVMGVLMARRSRRVA